MSRKKDLKGSIEDELQEMMKSKDEPSEGRMKLLKLGIGFLAVQAKLEESEYGGFFDGDTDARQSGSPSKRKKSGVGGDEGSTVTVGFLGDEGEIPS